jgi:succinate dehydrogenase/fumarate reductase flavoprotein subunit
MIDSILVAVWIDDVKMSASEYDLVVIGSGPAGQKCAIAAAKARKRGAIIG